jgi:hypothetical protein
MRRGSGPTSANSVSASGDQDPSSPAAGYRVLELVRDVTQNLWDAAALICLDEDRTLRYTELHRRMASFAGRHLSESELTRTRHRLVRRELIEARRGPNGGHVYTITQAGQARLQQIHILMDVAASLDVRPTDG